MLFLPLQSIPSQSFTTVLNNQSCSINVYQRSTGLYFDLSVNDSPIVQGILCLNLVVLVRLAYLGFVGDFAFWDMLTTFPIGAAPIGSDPDYTGLGDRYQLTYLEPADLPAGLS